MSNFKEGDSIRYISDDKHGDGKSQHGGTVAVHHEKDGESKHVATATHIGGVHHSLKVHDSKYDNLHDRATITTGLGQHYKTLKNSTKHKFDDKGGGTWATKQGQHAVHNVHSGNIGMPPLKLETKAPVKSLKGKESSKSPMTVGRAQKLKASKKKSSSWFGRSLSKMDKLIEMTEELVKSSK